MQDIARTHRVRRLRWQARAARGAQGLAPPRRPRGPGGGGAAVLWGGDGGVGGGVAAALREALAAAQVRPLSPGAAPSPWSLPVPAAEAPHAVLVPEAMADALRQYLATGTLPWALAGMAPEAVQEA